VTEQQHPASPATTEPQWIAIARAEVGVKERAGDADHPRIQEYLRATTIPQNMVHDATPWCSAFANWCMQQAGYHGTRKANARSWLTWGEGLDEPRPGCVVVLWRGSPESSNGHVAFFERADDRHVFLLGGNQNDRVCAQAYPLNRVLAYRWPTAAERTAHG
jgi:uncharacterized protein (TIGR02594 family)